MKTIVKAGADGCLEVAKENGWSWDDFHANAYDDYIRCRGQALEEQDNECAYTGLWLGDGTKQIIHIDHFRKKSIYPGLTFCWHNLFVAAKNRDYGADFKDRKIHGPSTFSDGQYDTFFSPLEANLKDYFWYRQDGKIEPSPEVTDEDLLAKIRNTIEMFNLNAADLKYRRQCILAQVRGLEQLDDETVSACMITAGFSFVVEFELQHR